jgi:uncharacterized protein (TIGR00266 family)
MNFKIEHRPDFSWLTVAIPKDKKLFVEASAMASMSTNMRMKTKMKGGLSRIISGESLFLSEFKANAMDGEVTIAPGPFGDISHFELKNETVYLSSSSYVAHTDGIVYETKFQNVTKGLFSGAGWFLVKMSGVGHLWYSGYGAITEINVEDDVLIDNNHLVAFTSGLEYTIEKLGNYKSFFFSGEGFVCRFRGQGKVFVQTKKPSSLINWANRFRPVKKSN